MTRRNHLNVYSGPQSVRDLFDPDCHPPLPLVEIPNSLNPYQNLGVRIYAKMMSLHPATNIKVIPAMNLLEKNVEPGKAKTIVESSSGSTVISMAMVAGAVHGISDVHAYLSHKTTDTKLRLMQFFGLDVTLFGGPAQPSPVDERGGIRAAARKAAESESICIPNQYQNDDNWKAHERWTAPQIHQQLPEIHVIAASMGTTGTMTGLGEYFGKAKPSVYRIAVCTRPGERVPGPREFSLMSEVRFPFQSAMDALEEVGSGDAYCLSLDLTRQGIVCGPSSGLALQGLFQRLEKRKEEGSLPSLAGPDGEINCVFMCCDLPYQYVNDYFDKLGPEKFKPVRNVQLRHVDFYRYDDAWERDPMDALSNFFTLQPVDSRGSALPPMSDCVSVLGRILETKPNTHLLDFRTRADFDAFHLPDSINILLAALRAGAAGGSPFADPVGDCTMLEELWRELEGLFATVNQDGSPNASAEALMAMLCGKRVLTICYDGDSARVVNSVLRARGVSAESIRGGFHALAKFRLSDPGSSEQSGGCIVSVEV